MRIQLWSYNYAPEPQGIAPLSEMLARSLAARGHEVLVVAAHPHYPEPVWGTRLRPYRERRDGIHLLRLPLWPGRTSGLARIRQELTFTAAQSIVAPLLPDTDIIVAVTPSFPALAPVMALSAARRTPWVMWLQDIATDGAATTGELKEGLILRGARRFESAAYAAASAVVVISSAFEENLVRKGVPREKTVKILNPSSRASSVRNDIRGLQAAPPRILAMGNIGHSQGLDRIVDAFQAQPQLAELDARLVIAGSGVAAADVRARIRGDSVVMTGVLYGAELEPEMRSATIGLVSQRADIAEFNLPSKLMNYLAYGIPVLASVRLGSETARIVEESGAGWVTDADHPAEFAVRAAKVVADAAALDAASAAGFDYARRHLTPTGVAERFERVLLNVTSGRPPRQR